jgi:hypothetical protein
MAGTDRRRMLAKTYGDLFADVARIMQASDPMQLIAIGAPDDEYEPEIGTVLPRLKEATSSLDVRRIVHEEFSRWFGDDMAGTESEYEAVSVEIWAAWQRYLTHEEA